MTADELLDLLAARGVDLTVVEGKLRVNAAKGQLTDEIKDAIATHKSALIAILDRAGESLPLAHVPRSGRLPLSFFQERLWVLHRFEPASTAYNLVTAWPSTKPVSVERVCSALREIVGRHEMLRARFHDDAGTPSVEIMGPDAVAIEVRDIRGLSADEQLAAVDAAMTQAAHTPYDLTARVPVRVVVFQGADDRVVTVFAAHHIVVDAWSIGLIGREVLAAYADMPLPAEAGIEYVDYAAWQRRTHDRRSIAPELAWWKQKLAGSPPVSTLPADGPRSSVPKGSSYAFQFSDELSAGIREIARDAGVTVYMALFGACAAMLKWYSGQEDIVLGCPMGVRERPEFEGVVGPFVNVLALRLDLSGDPTFAQVFARAREAMLDGYAHRNVSFEQVVEHLNPARSLDHAPLFQVAVIHHAEGGDGGRPITSGGAIFDLTWFVREVEGRMMCGLEYRADIYTAQTIARVASRLEVMLSAAVANRDQHLSQVAIVAEEESRQVLGTFNDTGVELDPAPFVEQFQRQAALSPAAVALSFGGASLTYRELDERSNRAARYLLSVGVGTGVIAGLCMRRSLEMVITLIGIQKAGAAYLPLDPDFPVERLKFMLADSDAHALITTGPPPDGLDALAGTILIDAAACADAIGSEHAGRLVSAVSPADLAYLIYTSGSTGRPKGVRIPHRALSNFLGAMRRQPGIQSTDRLAALTTLSFDIAGLELYLPLVTGASVELVSRDEAVNGRLLADRLMQSRASVMQATPSTWRMLVEAGWRPGPGFRALCGGEALLRNLANDLLDRVDELWNMYGPTETTIWSTVERVGPGAGSIAIGRPIANTQVYVVDKFSHAMPVGVIGEIWIGGAGVASGYHGRAGLTAERFVPDRFGPTADARLYRTGDLGRWLPDGRLEHLGRIDNQVKIRGFRIELGEIEAVLATHPLIASAMVDARAAGVGDHRLVAYVKYKGNEDLTASEVRKYLRRELPEYMIPSVIVALESVPLTPNGKIDRAALPDPFQTVRRAAANHAPPAPGTEQSLADIWREVLAVDTVSADDNFFELGGHSLLSLRVAAMAEKRLGWRMDPRVLFFQTLRQVAAAASEGDPQENAR